MKQFHEWLVENSNIIEQIRTALKGVKRDGQDDSLQVWYHPLKQKAFISVGDWADSKAWAEAVKSVVGKGNIKCEPEASPSGEGWVHIRDYHRLRDSIAGIDEERRKVLGYE